MFFSIGNLSASTQEIADFAGVKRTLVNYYFGSKHKLFEIVFNEIRSNFDNKIIKIVSTENILYDKVSLLIDEFSSFINHYPKFNIYLIATFNTSYTKKNDFETNNSFDVLKKFFSEINDEMDKGTIPKMDPFNFYINIFALVSYPIVMRPFYDHIFKISKPKMDKTYLERKQVILDLIFQNK